VYHHEIELTTDGTCACVNVYSFLSAYACMTAADRVNVPTNCAHCRERFRDKHKRKRKSKTGEIICDMCKKREDRAEEQSKEQPKDE
jgi:hypothetical protein